MRIFLHDLTFAEKFYHKTRNKIELSLVSEKLQHSNDAIPVEILWLSVFH